MFCFVLQRTPTNENNSGTEWQGIQQLLQIIFLISGRIIKFFHLLGEEKQELCFKIVDMIAERKYKQTNKLTRACNPRANLSSLLANQNARFVKAML